MRKGEVVNLRWEDFNWDKKIVTVQAKKKDDNLGIFEFMPKSKKSRTIPIKDVLRDILMPYKKDNGYVILFDNYVNRENVVLSKDFQEITKTTGIKFTAHLFRHTFASLAANSGKNIYSIQKWLGHSNVQITTDTYAHLQDYDEGINDF